MAVITKTMAQRRGTTSQWSVANRILLSGEIGYDTVTKTFRVGNDTDIFENLEEFIPASEIATMIATALENIGGGGDGDPQTLVNHINSSTPHPVYDDLPSLVLIYENGKV